MSGLEGFCSSKVTHPWQTPGSERLVAVTGSSASLVTATTQVLVPCYFHRRFANLISSPLHQSSAPAQ